MFLRFFTFIIVWPLALSAQDWDCSGDRCVETTPRTEAVVTGNFSGHPGISPNDADAFAALEQQSWREFQFLALSPQYLTVTIDDNAVNPPRPRVSTYVSEDGETFRPFELNALIGQDQIVSIILSQARSTDAREIETFFAHDFRLLVSTRRVLARNQIALFADLPSLSPMSGGTLGCTNLGCGEDSLTAGAPPSRADRNLIHNLKVQAPRQRQTIWPANCKANWHGLVVIQMPLTGYGGRGLVRQWPRSTPPLGKTMWPNVQPPALLQGQHVQMAKSAAERHAITPCRCPLSIARKRRTERWPSGRRRTPGKCVGGRPSPGFESLSLRHQPIA